VRQLRKLGLCLLAAFAMGATAAATASAALPEWGKCVKFVNQHGKNVGKYQDSGCTKLAEPAKSGGFEWQTSSSIAEKAFTSHGGAAELETTSGIKTLCRVEEAKGLLSGSKEVSEVEVIFKGCEASFGNIPCGNGIQPPLGEEPEGQIRTRSLKGKLGYISGKGEETPSVGLTLEPTQKKGLFAEFICGNTLVVRVGEAPKGVGGDSIISPITPVDVMSIAQTQTYTQEKGIQKPTALEGGKEDFLETEISDGFGEIAFAESGQMLTTVNSLNSGEKIEIRAFIA
jgi:hypothetical protein